MPQQRGRGLKPAVDAPRARRMRSAVDPWVPAWYDPGALWSSGRYLLAVGRITFSPMRPSAVVKSRYEPSFSRGVKRCIERCSSA